MNDYFRFFDYACDRYYWIEMRNYPATIKGILLNYNGKVFTVLSEEGFRIFPAHLVQEMHPAKIRLDKIQSERYKELLQTIEKEYNNGGAKENGNEDE